MIKYNKTKKGFAVLELIFYITFFSLFSLVVIQAIITMAKAFKETTLQSEFVQSGNIVEKISREIRQANGVTVVSSSDLHIDTKDEFGTSKTVEFLLNGSNIQLLENSTLIGNVNTPNINITTLSFAQITTTQGKAIKLFLTVRSTNDTLARTKDFYDTVVLRGDY